MRSSKFVVVQVVLGLALMAAVAHAQVCTDPGNLTTNCGFISDVSGWPLQTGTRFTHVPAIGNQGPGSGQGVSIFDGMGESFAIQQCVSGVADSTDYGFGMVVMITAGTPDYYCWLYAQEYSDAACTTYLASTSTSISSFTAGWDDVAGSFTSNASTQSVLMIVSCGSMSPFTIGVDDIYLGPGLVVPVELSQFKVE